MSQLYRWGGQRCSARSPCSHPLRSAGTLRALNCFNTVPDAFPSISVLWIAHKKKSRGAQDFRGVLPRGLPPWAAPSSRQEVILPAEKLKGLPLRPRLTPRRQPPCLPPAPLGPWTSAAPPAPGPGPGNTSACLALQAISWSPRPGTRAKAP